MKKLTLLPFLALLLPHAVVSQMSVDRSTVIQLEFSYFSCVDPQECACVAVNNDDKRNCPECSKWKQEFLKSASTLNIGTDSFAYKTVGKPSNRQFLNLASQQVYGMKLPRTANGFPVSAAQLYQDPGRFGWIVLGPDDPKEGALAIWPSFGGVVINDHRRPGYSGLKQIDILYPSDKLMGDLNVTSADHLGAASPKFIVPKEFVVDNITVTAETPPQ